jgi:hypothetical protein
MVTVLLSISLKIAASFIAVTWLVPLPEVKILNLPTLILIGHIHLLLDYLSQQVFILVYYYYYYYYYYWHLYKEFSN